MWDVLLTTEQEAKELVGSILTTKTLQTEYIGIRRTKVTVHGVSVNITEDRMEAFYAQYGKVEEVSGVISKAGIATGDIVLQVTLIPNVLMCRERRMLLVVEGRRLYKARYHSVPASLPAKTKDNAPDSPNRAPLSPTTSTPPDPSNSTSVTSSQRKRKIRSRASRQKKPVK